MDRRKNNKNPEVKNDNNVEFSKDLVDNNELDKLERARRDNNRVDDDNNN